MSAMMNHLCASPQTSLSVKYRSETSTHGIPLSVLKSALQKYIRRGNVQMADYVAGQLLSFISADDARKWGILTNFVHRLMIIFLEDCCHAKHALGPVDSGISVILDMLKLREACDVSRLACAIANVVAILCAIPKSRENSHARNMALAYLENGAQPTHWPPIMNLYDSINRDRNGRSWSESLMSSRPSFASYIYAMAEWKQLAGIRLRRSMVSALAPDAETGAVLVRWLGELNGLREDFLLVYSSITWRISGNDTVPSIVRCGCGAARLAKGIMADGNPVERYMSSPAMVLDEYVYDMHTGRHNVGNRHDGKAEFALVGSHVENESPYVDKLMKEFYMYSRTATDGETSRTIPALPIALDCPINLETETGAYSLVVRAQLTTSAAKQDVYLAISRSTGRSVFVKGPYISSTAIDNAIRIANWKRLVGLPCVPVWMEEMYPDRWPEGVPLGSRNYCKEPRKYPFMISESMLVANTSQNTNVTFTNPAFLAFSPRPSSETVRPRTRIHSSKLWPETEVLEEDASIRIIEDWDGMSVQEKDDYVLAVCMRAMIGIGDLADRNFCRKDGRIYSIDEDREMFKDVSLANELRVKKYTHVRSWFETRIDRLLGIVCAWPAPGFGINKNIRCIFDA